MIPVYIVLAFGCLLILWWYVLHSRNRTMPLVTGRVIGYRQFPTDETQTDIRISSTLRWLQVVQVDESQGTAQRSYVVNPAVARPLPLDASIQIRILSDEKEPGKGWVENSENYILYLGLSACVLAILPYLALVYLS